MKKEIRPPCSRLTRAASMEDGDCQADKEISKNCPYEWLGTCRCAAEAKKPKRKR